MKANKVDSSISFTENRSMTQIQKEARLPNLEKTCMI